MILFSIGMLCLSATPVMAGGSSSNGGNAALDAQTGEVRFLDLIRLPSTVFFDFRRHPSYQILVDKLNSHEGYAAAYFAEEGTPAVRQKILEALNKLSFSLAMDGRALPDPKDTGVVVLPGQDKVKRLALQEIESRKVLVDGKLLEKMTDTDIAALLLHEALIRLWYEDSFRGRSRTLKSTAEIADIVNMTFADSRFTKNLSPKAVSAKMCQAGIKVGPVVGEKLSRQNDSMAFPNFAKEFVLFSNKDCVVKKFKRVGPWKKVKNPTNGGVYGSMELSDITENGESFATIEFEQANYSTKGKPQLSVTSSDFMVTHQDTRYLDPDGFSIWAK